MTSAGMYVVSPSDASGATTMVWATEEAVMSAVLEAVAETTGPGASGAPGSVSARPPRAMSKASSARDPAQGRQPTRSRPVVTIGLIPAL